MAGQGQIIVQTAEGLEIKGRRKFAVAATFDAMIDDLVTRLTKQIELGKKKVISDLDLSQNNLTREQWETLFYTLQVAEATVVRFRLFGCPTLNDEVMQVMADYFRSNLDAESCPTEMHLSDCAITAEGFQSFVSAIEETELYPKPSSNVPSKGTPLYLRLENNYISEEAIQEKVEAGVVQPFSKNKSRSCDIEGGPKIHLVVKAVNAGFQQKSGEPPPPEKAAPPKEVWDWNSQQKQQKWGDQKGTKAEVQLAKALQQMFEPKWNNGKQSWNAGKNSSAGKGGSGFAATVPGGSAVAVKVAPGVVGGKGATAPVVVPGKGAAPAKGVAPAKGAAAPVVVPGKGAKPVVVPGKGAAPVVVPGKGAAPANSNLQLQKGKQSWNQQQQQPQQTWQQQQQQKGNSQKGWQQQQKQPIKVQVGATQGTAGSASDRSRTPAPRNVGPQAVPPKKGTGLPHPWQEHWSEEFNLPYFWNSETGESLWEKKPGW